MFCCSVQHRRLLTVWWFQITLFYGLLAFLLCHSRLLSVSSSISSSIQPVCRWSTDARQIVAWFYLAMCALFFNLRTRLAFVLGIHVFTDRVAGFPWQVFWLWQSSVRILSCLWCGRLLHVPWFLWNRHVMAVRGSAQNYRRQLTIFLTIIE